MLLMGMWTHAAALENSLVVAHNVKHRIIIWPSNSTPKYIYPREMKIHVHAKTCTQMLITALFIIAKM